MIQVNLDLKFKLTFLNLTVFIRETAVLDQPNYRCQDNIDYNKVGANPFVDRVTQLCRIIIVAA